MVRPVFLGVRDSLTELIPRKGSLTGSAWCSGLWDKAQIPSYGFQRREEAPFHIVVNMCLKLGCHCFQSSKGRGKGWLLRLMDVNHTGFAGHTQGLREPGVGKLPLGKRMLAFSGASAISSI